MRSGLVLILELVPVADIRKNAHRCVIRYNRDDVIAARGDRLPLVRHAEVAEACLQVVGDAGFVDEARRQVGAAHRVDRGEADQVGE